MAAAADVAVNSVVGLVVGMHNQGARSVPRIRARSCRTFATFRCGTIVPTCVPAITAAHKVLGITQASLALCSAPSRRVATLRPQDRGGLRALTAPARRPFRQLRDGRRLRPLPGWRQPDTNTHGRLLALGNRDERRLDVHDGSTKGIDDVKHERRREMARTEVHDPDERRAAPDSRPAEGCIVRDHGPAQASRGIEHVGIRSACQCLVPHRAHIVATRSQTADDLRGDVLVRQKREVQRLHAVICRSHVRSPRNTLAA